MMYADVSMQGDVFGAKSPQMAKTGAIKSQETSNNFINMNGTKHHHSNESFNKDQNKDNRLSVLVWF